MNFDSLSTESLLLLIPVSESNLINLFLHSDTNNPPVNREEYSIKSVREKISPSVGKLLLHCFKSEQQL